MIDIKFEYVNPLAQLYPPLPAKRMLPEWYKNISAYSHPFTKGAAAKELNQMQTDHAGTVKKCMPVMDYITSGYILRNFIDISITREWPKGEEDCHIVTKHAAQLNPIAFHSPNQMPIPEIDELSYIYKFVGYWTVRTPPGYSTLFYQPHYFFEKRFTVMPAIVDTDVFEEPVSFPFVWNDKGHTRQDYEIEAGTPLVVALPFKRDEFQHSIAERKSSGKPTRTEILLRTVLENMYKKFFHQKKKYD